MKKRGLLQVFRPGTALRELRNPKAVFMLAEASTKKSNQMTRISHSQRGEEKAGGFLRVGLLALL